MAACPWPAKIKSPGAAQVKATPRDQTTWGRRPSPIQPSTAEPAQPAECQRPDDYLCFESRLPRQKGIEGPSQWRTASAQLIYTQMAEITWTNLKFVAWKAFTTLGKVRRPTLAARVGSRGGPKHTLPPRSIGHVAAPDLSSHS